jgi:RND family efflux transporter MFP subunit
MKHHFTRATSLSLTLIDRFRALTGIQKGLVVLIALGGFIFLTHSPAPVTQEGEAQLRTVTVMPAQSLSEGKSPLTILGTVTSVSEAQIRAEAGGRIKALYRKQGDYVTAGSVILELDNDTERAALLSAEGAYEAALAGSAIATISKDSSGQTLEEANNSAKNTLESVYATLDDVIRTKTDTAWDNPLERDAKLRVEVADAKLVIVLESERSDIETMLANRARTNDTLTSRSNMIQELTTAEDEANRVRQYLDNLALAMNRAIPDARTTTAQIEGYKTTIAIARTQVSGSIAQIAGSRTQLNQANTGASIATQNASSGAKSGTSDAQVKLALGNLRASEARLAQTIVRSPIGGTLNVLTVSLGDYLSPYADVATVANNGALEIIAYVTEDERLELSVGSSVILDGGHTGVISRIGSALDPRTQKVEVRIAIVSSKSPLVNGTSVRVAIPAREKLTQKPDSPLSIPLAAIKLTPSGAKVFSVDENSMLVAHEVTPGELRGGHIDIVAGLSGEDMIVTDARGLKEGTKVNVATGLDS